MVVVEFFLGYVEYYKGALQGMIFFYGRNISERSLSK